MALRTISCLTIAGLAILGGYSLHVFGENNGLFPAIVNLRSKHVLPTSSETATVISFPETFTGYDPPDGLLATLLVFFWPFVDGSNPGGSLLGVLFAGQTVAVWTAAVLEGSRMANKWKIVSFTTIYGILVQTVGFAVVGPVYLTLYLLTSPLVKSTAPLTPAALAIPQHFLQGIPFGVLLGFILPTVLIALPQPEILSFGTKIAAVLVWQLFPVWTALSTSLWSIAAGPKSDTPAKQLPLLRNVYKFALAISVPAHIATLTLSLGTLAFPTLFAPRALETLHPFHVFVPPNPFDDVKASTVAQGAHWFLQYDYIITSLAYLIWAVTTRYAAPVSAVKPSAGRFGFVSLLDIIARSVVLGPMSAALTLLWDRDEVVFAATERVESKKTA